MVAWAKGVVEGGEKKKVNRISSVQLSCSVMSNSLRPYGLQHLKQIGKVKKLEKWVLIENLKKCCFEVLSLVLHNNSEPFLNWIVTCNKCEFYVTAGDDQFSGWRTSKALPKAKLAQKKKKKKLFGGLLSV